MSDGAKLVDTGRFPVFREVITTVIQAHEAGELVGELPKTKTPRFETLSEVRRPQGATRLIGRQRLVLSA